MTKRYSTALLFIAVASLILNTAWENLQAPLYAGYGGLATHFPVCLRASLGDMLIVLFIYGLFTVMYKDALWFKRLDWRSLVALVIVGAGIAIGIEKLALSVQRWDYAPGMPIIPLVEVGLTPILQMMILPSVIFYLARKYIARV